MSCEVCGKETSKRGSEEPADGVYFTAVFGDDETPEGALNRVEYEFCCVDHLEAFVPEDKK